MIVLDASVLIAHLEAGDAHHQQATELLIGAGTEQLGASPLTLAEVLVGPARIGALDAAQAVLRTLEIVAIPLAGDSPGRLADLRVSTRLRLPDCCVLLAAQQADASVATFDVRLAAAAAALGIRVR